ncbi:hypothetical protein BOW53_15415 [Solemya pervernicosa gill symbiont]|uniref:ATPase n=2 Tax=Gammaproteobacteria incertae sedis TaxID=118884 RepID=A0A1T2L0K4_9GAMM|nr:ABC-ATPase domain-containing protein [Candidatus Reidiella endopervernicosa]OOZ38486.1 hypothetical protein BOW53_15415 [Solemya pervernicosa gill symbiont]QKQ26561.1 ABC-ATPase domain-containing protein [Candidatus Reidiella endopervernicosa]
MQQLETQLKEIDQRGYKAYKSLQGCYSFPRYQLFIDHVQGDPFAEPSRCRILIEADEMSLPAGLFSNAIRTIALEDYLGRHFAEAIKDHVKGHRGSGRSGEVAIASYGQQVLQRNAVLVRAGSVEVRFQLALPADARRVNGREAQVMLFEELPKVVETGLFSLLGRLEIVEQHVDSVEDQQALRDQLVEKGLVAFVAEGSRLPRATGVDDRPLEEAVLFEAPDSMRVALSRPHGADIVGMGIAEGVTLIVGGGFHGKSTLLHAIERGVYNHIPGDGRERVVSRADAVKVRAEDGRAITGVDISPFINNLPQGKDTARFTTANGSGSTSQAAAIMEALATDCSTLLIDEDTSATNFMIRDRRMQALVAKEREPITPLVQRIRDLYQQNGVSVVLVMGGSGDFFSVADRVIMMDNYRVRDVTGDARALAVEMVETEGEVLPIKQRSPRITTRASLSPHNRQGREKIQPYGVRSLRYGEEEIDLTRVEQLVDNGQLRAIGYLLSYCEQQLVGEQLDLNEMLDKALNTIKQQGLDALTPYIIGTLALPRLQELAATVNRMRRLELVT